MSEATHDDSETAYYHVVCRDCPTESIQNDAEAAERAVSRHEDETDHRVVVGSL